MVIVGDTDVDLLFLERVQNAFKPEDMSQQRLEEWLTMGPKGKHIQSKGEGKTREVKGVMSSKTKRKIKNLAGGLSETKDVYDEAEVEVELRKLRSLGDEARREVDFDVLTDLQKDVGAEAEKVRVDISDKSDRLKREIDKLAVHKDKVGEKVEISVEQGLEEIEKVVRKVNADVKVAERVREVEIEIAERIEAERLAERIARREEARIEREREIRTAELEVAERISRKELREDWKRGEREEAEEILSPQSIGQLKRYVRERGEI